MQKIKADGNVLRAMAMTGSLKIMLDEIWRIFHQNIFFWKMWKGWCKIQTTTRKMWMGRWFEPFNIPRRIEKNFHQNLQSWTQHKSIGNVTNSLTCGMNQTWPSRPVWLNKRCGCLFATSENVLHSNKAVTCQYGGSCAHMSENRRVDFAIALCGFWACADVAIWFIWMIWALFGTGSWWTDILHGYRDAPSLLYLGSVLTFCCCVVGFSSQLIASVTYATLQHFFSSLCVRVSVKHPWALKHVVCFFGAFALVVPFFVNTARSSMCLNLLMCGVSGNGYNLEVLLARAKPRTFIWLNLRFVIHFCRIRFLFPHDFDFVIII